MAAPVRVPQLQENNRDFPGLAVPKRGWRRSAAAERSLEGGGHPPRVYLCRVGDFRLSITEMCDGRLSGTLSDASRLWLLSDHSTLLCWMAAMQCQAH